MAQSLSNILVHIVFSTKDRVGLIDEGIEAELQRYLATACTSCKCPAHKIGGTEDHVHLVVSLARTVSVAELVQKIKVDSSQWIKTKDRRYEPFAWQGGYGAFSIGQSQLGALKAYIERQRDHHARRDFKEEFRALLRKYQVDYDERYVWD